MNSNARYNALDNGIIAEQRSTEEESEQGDAHESRGGQIRGDQPQEGIYSEVRSGTVDDSCLHIHCSVLQIE